MTSFNHVSVWCVCAISMSLVGCPSVSSNPPVEPDVDLPSGSGAQRAALGLSVELYGPGSSWYDYEPSTHALSPRPVVYVVHDAQTFTLLEVVSYYDERGTSGVFTLRAKSHVDGVWGEVQSLITSKNIKTGTVCIGVPKVVEVPCEQGALALRSAWRALPEAGFAVQEPALYPLSDFQELTSTRLEIAALVANSLDDVSEDVDALGALARLPHAGGYHEDSLVGWMTDPTLDSVRQDVHVQVTANMDVVQWRVLDVSSDGAQMTWTFGVRCEALDQLGEMPAQEETSQTVTLPITGAYDGVFVRWCDAYSGEARAGMVAAMGAPVVGLWPDTKSFDVMVEHVAGRGAIRLAPGNLLSNETARQGAQGAQALDLSALFAQQVSP